MAKRNIRTRVLFQVQIDVASPHLQEYQAQKEKIIEEIEESFDASVNIEAEMPDEELPDMEALDHGDECPYCENGTIEIVDDEIRCRGECGFIYKIEK